jgi:hypothetical protein
MNRGIAYMIESEEFGHLFFDVPVGAKLNQAHSELLLFRLVPHLHK